MHILARLCGAIVQLFNDLARRKFFSMRGVFLPRIFCGGVGVKIYHGFSRNFLWRILPRIFTDFGHGFSQFFMALGGIILGSMSEKIVGIFILNK